MKWSTTLLALLVAGFANAESDSALLDLLPPGTRVVIGVRVRAVADSALARSLGAQIQSAAAGAQSAGTDWQKLISLPGFDPFHDIDEVVIGSTGEGENAPVLIVARGSFDAARLAPDAKPYHGVPLMQGAGTVHGKKASGVFAFLDGNTVLAGEAAEVKAAIDRRSTPVALNAKLAARVAEFRSKYEIWGVVDRPEGLQQLVASSGGPQGLDSIDRLQFGVGLAHGLELLAEIHSRSPKDAEQLSASLRLLEAMFQASQQTSANGTKLALHTTGENLRIALTIPEEELKKSIEAQLRARQVLGARAAHTTEAAPVGQSQTTPAGPSQTAAPVRIQSAERERPMTAADPSAPGTAVFTLPSRP